MTIRWMYWNNIWIWRSPTVHSSLSSIASMDRRKQASSRLWARLKGLFRNSVNNPGTLIVKMTYNYHILLLYLCIRLRKCKFLGPEIFHQKNCLSNHHIFIDSTKFATNVTSQSVKTNSQGGTSNNRNLDNQLKTRRKVAKMLIAVVIMFAINFFPVHFIPMFQVNLCFHMHYA